MVINVTQEDIDNGKPCYPYECAVALAVTRAGIGFRAVRKYGIYCNEDIEPTYRFPKKAQEFVSAFDGFQPVAPIVFTAFTEQQLTNARRWVAALRSGDYTQGYTNLRNEDRFCCLGVAVDLLGCEWHKTVPNIPIYGGSDAYGLSLQDVHDLWNLNDEPTPFAEVADYIEQEIYGGLL